MKSELFGLVTTCRRFAMMVFCVFVSLGCNNTDTSIPPSGILREGGIEHEKVESNEQAPRNVESRTDREIAVDTEKFIEIAQQPAEYESYLSGGALGLAGVVRSIVPNRLSPCNLLNNERHVIEIWHDDVDFHETNMRFYHKPFYTVFNQEQRLDELSPNHRVTIECMAPKADLQQLAYLVKDCKIVEVADVPPSAVNSVNALSAEELTAAEDIFKQAVDRLKTQKLLGITRGTFELVLANDALTESGDLKPDIVKEFPNLKMCYSLSIPREVSGQALLELSEGLPNVKKLNVVQTLQTDSMRKTSFTSDDLAPISDWGLEWIESDTNRFVSNDVLTGIGHLKTLRGLSFTPEPPRLSDDVLEAISDLPNLQELYLTGRRFTDDGLGALSKLENLRMLSIGGDEITGSGLAALAGLKHLFYLELWAPQGTPDSLAAIGDLKSLTWLRVHSFGSFRGDPGTPDVGDASFVKSLPKLKVLELQRVDGIKTGFSASLGVCENLMGLDIKSSEIEDGTLQSTSLSNLKVLNLAMTTITDNEVRKFLDSAPALEYLQLYQTPVTDKLVSALTGTHPNLLGLGLDETQITKACANSLIKLQKLKRLSLSDPPFSYEEAEKIRNQISSSPIASYP